MHANQGPSQEQTYLSCAIRRFSFALKALGTCAVLFGGCLCLIGTPLQDGKQVATIRQIAVTGDDRDLDIEITATQPLTAHTQTVTDPDRLIVDLPDALPGAGLHKVLVNRGNLRDVRVGLLSASPRITRVVLDLTSPTQYRVLPFGNTTVVKLGDESGSGSEAVAATTKPPAASTAKITSEVGTTPLPQASEPSRARWILPILVIAAVLGMLAIALISFIQNRRASRGI
jgi:hypothetical protein